MKTLSAAFKAEGEALRRNAEYRLDAFYIDVVENITAAMANAEPKLTKAQLATLMGVSPARVTNLLRGYRPNMELKTVVQVALALGVEPHDLCGRRKTPEMMMRPLRTVPSGFVAADITEETHGKEEAA